MWQSNCVYMAVTTVFFTTWNQVKLQCYQLFPEAVRFGFSNKDFYGLKEANEVFLVGTEMRAI
jgi:hypothetical protein